MDSRTPLSDAEMDDLRAIAGVLIPSSSSHGLPGADDQQIFSQISNQAGALVGALRRLTQTLGESSGSLARLEREALEARLKSTFDRDVAAIYAIILMQYYCDDRVLVALGLEPRPPFPLGNALEEADPTLLDPVRARAPFWRRA